MKRSRFADQQIAFALQQAEQGTQLAEAPARWGSASRPAACVATYFWKGSSGIDRTNLTFRGLTVFL